MSEASNGSGRSAEEEGEEGGKTGGKMGGKAGAEGVDDELMDYGHEQSDARLPEHGHEPVLAKEVLTLLDVGSEGMGGKGGEGGKVVVDCTAGRGGHTILLAKALAGDKAGRVIAMDRDPRNLEYAQRRVTAELGKSGVGEVVTFCQANFCEIDEVVEEEMGEGGVERGGDGGGDGGVDGILADLGVSTNQLFEAAYGLSFREAMPLDMRLDPKIHESAADIINGWGEQDLADLIFYYGDERHSRRIAKRILEERKRGRIGDTKHLAELIEECVPVQKVYYSKGKRMGGGRGGKGGGGIHPATRTFMALRMQVNGEMANLERLLKVGPGLLKVGGRMAVISFHSGEDRVVKRAFKGWCDGADMGNARRAAAEKRGEKWEYELVTKKPVEPGEEEIRANPRSRSAKMRVLERVR